MFRDYKIFEDLFKVLVILCISMTRACLRKWGSPFSEIEMRVGKNEKRYSVRDAWYVMKVSISFIYDC